MNKLTGNEQIFDVVLILSDNNPGAVNVLMQLMTDTAAIDKDSALGYAGIFYTLDNLGIYGSDIWYLYKQLCQEKINLFIAVLRSVQLGLFDCSILIHLCTQQVRDLSKLINVDELYRKVRQELPNFDN